MKRMRRIGSVLTALLMALTLTVPAAAAENDTASITIQDTGAVMPMAEDTPVTRTYEGYRLLDLTTSLKCDITEGDHTHTDACYNYAYTVNGTYREVLQDVVFETDDTDWPTEAGEKPTAAADLEDAQIIAYLGSLTGDETAGGTTTMGTIRGFAEAVYEKIKEKNISAEESSNSGTFAQVEQGYWMIVDTTDLSGENEVHSLIIVDTRGEDAITVTPKISVPKVEKAVQENSTGSWGVSADYAIGDKVPFKLTGTVTEHYEYYKDKYTFIFHDTLSKGLTFDANSVKVWVDDAADPLTGGYTVETTNLGEDDTCSFHVVFDDLKTISSVHAGSAIRVEYTATVTNNSDLIIGNPGNPNEVKLEFSNDPNFIGTGDPGTPPTGETPPEKVVVFTFELDVTKVDASSKDGDTDEYSKKLADAWFVLYRNVKKTVAGEEKTVAEYALIDTSGKITSWSTTMPTHNVTVDGQTESKNGNLKSDTDGAFKIAGLDAGEYFLKETVAPAGYNLLKAPLELRITASVSDQVDAATGLKELQELKVSVNDGDALSGDVSDGSVEIIVENNSGTQLPGTGGGGTTIFYVLGGFLTVGASVLLITKKRMKKGL